MRRFEAFLGDECDVTLLDTVVSVFTSFPVHFDRKEARAGPGSRGGSI